MRFVQYLIVALGGSLIVGMVGWTAYLIGNTVVRYMKYGY